MKSNSWVIIKHDTQEVIMETWNESILKNLKPEFTAVPTYDYLVQLNKAIKGGNNHGI